MEISYARTLFFFFSNWTGILSRQCNSHTLTHAHSAEPTCVLLSFPDLVGESAGTSEALRECLEKTKTGCCYVGQPDMRDYTQTECLSESTKRLKTVNLAHLAFR